MKKITDDAITGLMASALFAVHPVQVEAVGAVFGVTDALMASWLLVAFWSYLKWREPGRAAWGFDTAAGGLLNQQRASESRARVSKPRPLLVE